MDLTWTYPILKTWTHILLGIGIIFIGIGGLGGIISWVRSIERQNELVRRLNNRNPDDWTP